jgi:hypothetical protein
MDGKIDLKELWKTEENKELNPKVTLRLSKKSPAGRQYTPLFINLFMKLFSLNLVFLYQPLVFSFYSLISY